MSLIVPIIIAAAVGVGAAEYRHRKMSERPRENPEEHALLPPSRSNPAARRGRSKGKRSKR
jgi:hypothetical protein